MENETVYKKQRNFCVKLLKKTKIDYYGSLKLSDISECKKFWNNVKPLFTDKCVLKDTISLKENTKVFKEEIISDDDQPAYIFNNFFSNVVKSLNFDFSFDCVFFLK